MHVCECMCVNQEGEQIDGVSAFFPSGVSMWGGEYLEDATRATVTDLGLLSV